MGRVNKRVEKAGDEKTPIRLTRLRAAIAGAPKIMRGLDARNRASESLPPDPERISAREVLRRLPRSHPKYRAKIKIVWNSRHSLSTAARRGGSASDENPGHEAESRPAPAEEVAWKRTIIKVRRSTEVKAEPKPDPIATELRRLPQTPPPKAFLPQDVLPQDVLPDIESPPNPRSLIKFRTEGLFDRKRPSSRAEEDGSGHNSEASTVMPGARRLSSREEFEDFERQGKSGKRHDALESAADDLCSSLSNSAPLEGPSSKRQRVSASADVVLPSVEDGNDAGVFRTPSVQSVEGDGDAVGRDFLLSDILPLTPQSRQELSFEIYRDPSGDNRGSVDLDAVASPKSDTRSSFSGSSCFSSLESPSPADGTFMAEPRVHPGWRAQNHEMGRGCSVHACFQGSGCPRCSNGRKLRLRHDAWRSRCDHYFEEQAAWADAANHPVAAAGGNDIRMGYMGFLLEDSTWRALSRQGFCITRR
ncbi:Uncharacterized protein TPAR_01448 [Tolypocladium paradoxum]|uniref:Uncharacterized protein n=1 Tax=Tolypocladium paradoxum TaxID=94208 RepID=A0A2S4L7H4_9HYPO|nr:Uncharacterized protein TPAR_01448 [Tolypocladium paradoxum]